MVTLVVEGRRKLFGHIEGSPSLPNGAGGAAHLEPSALGRAVTEEWRRLATLYPQVKNIALQLMPDHLHLIIFVMEKMPKPLGNVIAAFEGRCKNRYLALAADGDAPSVPAYIKEEQQAVKEAGRKSRYGLLFEPGFNDKILWREGELQAWIDYLADNPRRLAMKFQHPDMFCVKHNITYGGNAFSSLGNELLLRYPRRVFVQCSRKLTDTDIAVLLQKAERDFREGSVFVSPSVSPGEKAVMRHAFERHCPVVILRENGFAKYEKPHGRAFDACVEGRMLFLSPWEHHTDRRVITRSQCLTLNAMAEAMSTERL